jgi:flap endonuclease-1
MGNATLRTLAHIEELDLSELEGTTVAVDAYNWLYKYMTTISRFNEAEVYTTNDGVEIPTLIGVPRGLVRFFEHEITPIFIFDGDPHELKADELAARRKSKESAAKKASRAASDGNTIEAARFEARTQRIDSATIQTTKQLLDRFGIQYCTADGAGEAYAAALARSGEVDAVISDDYDCLLFGAPRTIRNFTSSSKPLECLSLSETLSELELTHEQLVDVAILCGTDYNPGITGVGPATAVSGIQTHKNIQRFLDKRDETIEHVTQIQEIFLTEASGDSVSKTTQTTPDIDSIRRYLSERSIDTSYVETSLEKIINTTSQP